MPITQAIFTRQFKNILAAAIQATPLPQLNFSSEPLSTEQEHPLEPASSGTEEILFRALPEATTTHAIYRLARRDRVVFLLLDGKRTLGDISRLTNRHKADISHSIANLHRMGYIESLAQYPQNWRHTPGGAEMKFGINPPSP